MAERVAPTLLTALNDVVRWLDGAHVPSTVIGGVAASILGRPRLTQDVDVLAILAEDAWESAAAAAAGFGIVPRVEDLLIMKAIAHRPKDLQDIAGLLAAHPNADTGRVRQWVREFSAAIGMNDMLDELDKRLARPNGS